LIHYGFPPVAFVFNLSITGFDRNGSFFLFIWAIYFTTYQIASLFCIFLCFFGPLMF